MANPIQSLLQGAGDAITPEIPFISVNSSNISAVRYNPLTLSLDILFNKGPTYRYFVVPPSTYAGLMSADSKGKYHAQNIKQSFSYAKL